MKTLVSAATSMELEAFKDSLHSKNPKAFKETRFLVSGIGPTETSYQLGKHLARNSYDIAIQLGICGSYRKDLKIGQALFVIRDLFVGSGIELKNGAIESLKDQQLPASSEVFLNPVPDSLQSLELPPVEGITVGISSGSKKTIEERRVRFDPDIESMEGACFFRAMEDKSIKAIQLRTVSNLVEPRNKDNWDIPLALKELEKQALRLIKLIHGS